MADNTLVLATRERRQAPRAARILDAVVQVRLVGLDDFPGAPEIPETGATFEENALLKARDRGVHRPARRRRRLRAVVDALNGMPGVLSARWAGRHGDDQANLDLVLGQVGDVPDVRLGARFACAAALVVPASAPPQDGPSVVLDAAAG